MLQGSWFHTVWIIGCLLNNAPLKLVQSVSTHHLRSAQHADSVGAAPPYNFERSKWNKPTGDFVPKSAHSEDWPLEREKWRERLVTPSATYTVDLKKLAKDDKDTYMWRNSSMFEPDNGTTQYWDALCNGTNTSKSNPLPGDKSTINASVVLAAWQKVPNVTCSKFAVDKSYSDPMEALMECGPLCDSIAISPTMPNLTYRLCQIGEPGENSTDNTYRLRKPPTYSAPEGLPRPPRETKFWKEFCAYRQEGKKLRVLWEDQTCATSVVKELTPATTPVECGKLTAKDTACSDVFDFKFGNAGPDVCRCVKKGQQCEPAASATGNVWVPY